MVADLTPMKTTTPQRITDNIVAACRTICDGLPRYIDSRPFADSRPSFCFANVAEQINRLGGRITYGWAIWQVPGLYLEAEHHGVWQQNADTLIDVSPQFNSPSQILFLADQAAVFDPDRLRQNRFFPDGESAIAIEFARLAQQRVDILNKFRNAESTNVVLPAAEQATTDSILTRLNELQTQHLS